MNITQHVAVLVAGAGPVGLTLAADLASRDVPCLIVDPRLTTNAHPRAISIGVRSMEHFRRLGVADAVIDAGVPRSQKLDVAYVTRLTGKEIFRFRIPSIDDLQTKREALAAATPEIAASPYYKTWTAQSPLERVLRGHLARCAQVETRYGSELVSFSEHPDGVDALLRDTKTGEAQTVRAQYLVGCDGASSTVREGLGLSLEGRGTLGRALGIHFSAPQLKAKLGASRAVMYWVMAPGCGGTIYMIDGGDEWVYNRYFSAGDTVEFVDAERLLRSAIGGDTPVEIRSVQDWSPRQLVATSYGTSRVFLAGDACHLFVPTGGFGMNTGIGDAIDLSWKLAACHHGWAGPRLLSTYDLERRPVGRDNTIEAADNYMRSGEMFLGLDAIERDDAPGNAARAQLAAKLPPKIRHFAPIGVHLGYDYAASPVIVPDGTPAPPRDAATYTPIARPGHRAPHGWLTDGRSTLDLFGDGFTLLAFEEDATGDFALAARTRHIPLSVVSLHDANLHALYGASLVLVRPDGHVAWRGAPPQDAGAILDIARGA